MTDGTLGEVLDMNWRATHLRAWDNTTHVTPIVRLGDATSVPYSYLVWVHLRNSAA